METKDEKPRCRWCNTSNPAYVAYHDTEWGVALHDDARLYEIFLLETFQPGLSWECVLNKREAFRRAFEGFDARRVAQFSEARIDELCQDRGIIRNRQKVRAAVVNARAFLALQAEFGSFDKYLWASCGGKTIYETGRTTSPLSDAISADLRRRGMKFAGSTVVYSLLQAVGIIYSHEPGCWLHKSTSRSDLSNSSVRST